MGAETKENETIPVYILKSLKTKIYHITPEPTPDPADFCSCHYEFLIATVRCGKLSDYIIDIKARENKLREEGYSYCDTKICDECLRFHGRYRPKNQQNQLKTH